MSMLEGVQAACGPFLPFQGAVRLGLLRSGVRTNRLLSHWRPGAAAADAGGTLVVVESPAKAKKIQTYLGPAYQVLASYGAIRQMPRTNGSVDPSRDFAMKWELTPRGKQQVREMAAAMLSRRSLVLATDPDREGEAIAWHIQEELQKQGALRGVRLSRITFTEVTKAAVLGALQAPRQISAPLVEASLARSALDYLVGFNLSPLLWRRIPGAKSAGRVQSVALRLLSEREAEIESFRAQEFWTFAVQLRLPSGEMLTAELAEVDGKKLTAAPIRSLEAAQRVLDRIRAARFKVTSVAHRTVSRSAPAPFTTSSMQQLASSLLGFSPTQTMQLAQQLYEGTGSDGDGFITYIRTDAVNIEKDALTEIRSAAGSLFGRDHLSSTPKAYKSKAKNSQEAHEAIRPTIPRLQPKQLPSAIDPQARQLYDLIWRRTLACQMADSKTRQTTVSLCSEGADLVLRAGSSEFVFQGFRAAYNPSLFRPPTAAAPSDGEEDDEAAAASVNLSALKQGQALQLSSAEQQQNFTSPPRRFSEASLIGALEERGIGRPSTYASIIRLLQDRGYVVRQRRSLQVEALGRVLTVFLTSYFAKYVDYGFTSSMEASLDRISAGEMPYKSLLHEFWGPFDADVQNVMNNVPQLDILNVINDQLAPLMLQPQEGQSEEEARVCPKCGGQLRLALSRAGNGFVGCSSYPDCTYKRPLQMDGGESVAVDDEYGGDGKLLGTHPETGAEVRVRRGPYGLYLEAAAVEGGHRQRAGLSDAQLEDFDFTLETACQVIDAAQPKTLGVLRSGRRKRPVQLLLGPYGPYFKCGKVLANIPKHLEPSALSLEDALSLLEAKAGPNGKRAKLPGGQAFYSRSRQQSQKGLTPAQLTEEWKLLEESERRSWAERALADWQKGRSEGRAGLAALLGLEQTEAAAVEVIAGEAATGSGRRAASNGSGQPRLSGYNLFCKQRRQELAAAGSIGSPQAVMAASAAEWKALSDDQKRDWAAKAAELFGEPSAKAKAAKANAAKPKPVGRQSQARGKTGYLVFGQAVRAEVQQQGLKPSEVMKVIGERWRQLSPQEKQVWSVRAGAGTADQKLTGTADAR